MTLIELIVACGEDKILAQFLNESMEGIQKTKKGDSLVSFYTDQIEPGNIVTNTGPIGMVIWLPREEYMRTINAGSN